MNIETLTLFFAATLAVNLTPGPSLLYVSSVAVSSGLRAAAVSILGMSVGILVHVLAAATGVTAIISASTTAFVVLKYLGAVYLIYLGLRLWFVVKADKSCPTAYGRDSVRRLFFRGFMVDLLNPKIGLFFLAFLPQFVGLDAGGVFHRTLVLGAVFVVVGGLVNGTVAVVAVRGVRIAAHKARRWIEHWIPGGVLLALGVRLAMEEP